MSVPALLGLGIAGLILLSFIMLLLMRSSPRETASAAPQGSPVPWIDDRVWQRLNPDGFLARRYAWRGGMISQPQIVLASDADRERGPRREPGDDQPVPLEGSVDELRRMLAQTQGRGQVRSPMWPACCGRLATLIALHCGAEALSDLEAAYGSLDRAFLEEELRSWGGPGVDVQKFLDDGWSIVLEQVRSGEHSGQGLAAYSCRHCGRAYVASCGP